MKTVFSHPLAFLLLAVASSVAARADLLVYEGFNGYNTGTIAGQNPNANTVGLNTSVAYYDGGGSRGVNFTLQSTGLELGSLQTTGGALAFSSTTNVVGAKINIGSTAFTGTLWSSYLVNLSSRGIANSNGAVVRVGTDPSDTSSDRFNSWSDSRASSSTTNVSVAYGPAGGTQPNNGTASLALDTTYIIINRFKNVGSALSGTVTGEATLWALNEAQFAAFLAAGGDEAALTGTSVTATASQTATSGTRTFASGLAIGLVTVNDVGVYDELRFGSSLADVAPIPEPATTAVLAGLAAVGACCLIRRRPRNG